MEDGYYAWMIVATALVLMMTTPALAFFYGGMTRTKSTLNMMMMSFTAMGAVGIAFVLWGWSIGWGGDGIGNGNGKLIASPLDTFGLMHVSSCRGLFATGELRPLDTREPPGSDLKSHPDVVFRGVL